MILVCGGMGTCVGGGCASGEMELVLMLLLFLLLMLWLLVKEADGGDMLVIAECR